MTPADRRTFLATAALTTVTGQVLSAAESTAKGPIRVGQIGTKHGHASGKMATLRKFPQLFEVVGICEADPERKKRVQGVRSYADLTWMTEEELLGQPDLEAVLVETDIDDLLPVAERCVQAGRHIHLDKPAGTSMAQFRRICAEADRQNLMLQMGYMYRSNPAFRFLFQAVREGWLGDVFQIHCEMSKKIGDAARVPLARYRGGSMFELGCHLLDAVVNILGPPQSVSAFNRNTRPDFDELQDTCLAVLEYPTATATVRSSVCEVEGFRRRQFVVCGTRGTIVIHPLEPFRLTLSLEQETGGYRRGTHEVELMKSTGRYDGDLQHFAAVIRGEEAAECDTQHDLAVQEAVLRASDMPLN